MKVTRIIWRFDGNVRFIRRWRFELREMKTEFQHSARFAIDEKRLRLEFKTFTCVINVNRKSASARHQHRNSAYKRDATKRAQWHSYDLSKSYVEYAGEL